MTTATSAPETKNANLHAAKRAKDDELYTQWRDIENEMRAYLERDPDVFRGKTILLPCDDPAWSNFTKYLAIRFQSLGIKRLVSTSYQPGGRGKVSGTDGNSCGDRCQTGRHHEPRVHGRHRQSVSETGSGDVFSVAVVHPMDLGWDTSIATGWGRLRTAFG